ncbi:MAG: DCC1-like thiol-disulfide oxidoreductase family protein [Crocinitomicaceae bacterium]|nr:DCC1-like thiol-disulfide oxidoreductase family protein [Crocinitomicaceae bacterium]
MKATELNTEYLLYDENCPLCAWYTRAFVKFGFIQGQARLSYQKAIKDDWLIFDRERAKSEIALVADGESPLYGVDSMLKVISKKWNIISYICRFLPIYWFLQLLYRFISFNRKIIAPTVCGDSCSCTPQFSLFWRATFIAFCGLVTYFMVGSYFNNELDTFLKHEYFSFEFVLFIGQLVFQTVVFKLLKQRDLFTYLGHVAFLSLLGALALGGAELGLSVLESFNLELGLLPAFVFGAVVTLMFVEHSRRVKLLGMSTWLTVSLIAFRMIIYPFVFNY